MSFLMSKSRAAAGKDQQYPRHSQQHNLVTIASLAAAPLSDPRLRLSSTNLCRSGKRGHLAVGPLQNSQNRSCWRAPEVDAFTQGRKLAGSSGSGRSDQAGWSIDGPYTGQVPPIQSQSELLVCRVGLSYNISSLFPRPIKAIARSQAATLNATDMLAAACGNTGLAVRADYTTDTRGYEGSTTQIKSVELTTGITLPNSTTLCGRRRRLSSPI